MKGRLLVFGALPVSLVVPVGFLAVAVAFGSQSEQTAIELPTAPTPRPSNPSSPSPESTSSADEETGSSTPSNTERFELFGGKSILVSRSCVASHNLEERKHEAVRAANRLPPLKQALLNRRRDYRAFLNQHPEKALASDDYARYLALKRAYESALTAHNRQIDHFNSLADSYNAGLEACKT